MDSYPHINLVTSIQMDSKLKQKLQVNLQDDIDGKEIYEGDIVEFGKEDTKYYNLPNVPQVLIYSEKFSGFFIRSLDTDKEERDFFT